jgi:hypothetical protein
MPNFKNGPQFGGDLNYGPGQVDLWGTLEVISSVSPYGQIATRLMAL